MDTMHTPFPSAAARRSLHTPAMVGVLLAVWFAASTFVLGYPHTLHGQDAALRDRGLILLLLLTSVCWLRAETHRARYLTAFAVVALVLGVESFAFGYGPAGDLMAAWWNEKIMALLMLVACAAGVVQERGERSSS
jgi:glucose-6-phosphate-specific signal transduction histidine kinase